MTRNGALNSSGKRILVLFAHPSPGRSEVNRPLAEAASRIDGVTLVDLYASYPDFNIDVDREQQRVRDLHDRQDTDAADQK